jgi:hypothetical protein
MKWLFILCFLAVACNNNSQPAIRESDTEKLKTADKPNDTVPRDAAIALDTALLIVPGQGIGKVQLGEEVSLLNVLGPPDSSDAAMGKAWLTWKGRRDEHNNFPQLNVYTTYKDNTMREKTVQQIRTTSSRFFTSDSIHVYSSLEAIQEKFPALRKAGSYNDEGREIVVYDEKKKGIAFEIATAGNQRICTGIIIHEKGKDVNEIYIMLHPGMKRY